MPLSGCDLKLLLTNRAVARGGRSLGTTRPPAVTRIPGGLPCSLRSLSALPRLIDGDGEGFLWGAVDAIAGVGGGRRFFSEVARTRFADAEGRKTCSAEEYQLDFLSLGQLKMKREAFQGEMTLGSKVVLPRNTEPR